MEFRKVFYHGIAEAFRGLLKIARVVINLKIKRYHVDFHIDCE